MTKHVEKVDEVKKEVNFFNNYLRVSLVFQLICDYIMVYHRTQSGLSCLSILRRRQVLEERVAQVRTGGREGEEILTSTGNICLPFLRSADHLNLVIPINMDIVMLLSGPPRDITQRPVYGGGRERGWEEGGRAGGGR